MLGPGGAKPAFAATVGFGVQELHPRKVRGGDLHEAELGEPAAIVGAHCVRSRHRAQSPQSDGHR